MEEASEGGRGRHSRVPPEQEEMFSVACSVVSSIRVADVCLGGSSLFL
jgi:hypothetical protein